MGYFTSVSGSLTALGDVSEDVMKKFKDEGVDFSRATKEDKEPIVKGDEVYLNFDWKMYCEGVVDLLYELAGLFDGEMNCHGEDDTDVWELHFKDKKVLVIDYEFIKKEPVEITEHPSWVLIDRINKGTVEVQSDGSLAEKPLEAGG